MADELRAAGPRMQSCLRFMTAAVLHVKVEAQRSLPAASLMTLNFLHVLSRHAPLVLASGFDCGVVTGALLDSIESLPNANRATAHKVVLELVCNLGAVLTPSGAGAHLRPDPHQASHLTSN